MPINVCYGFHPVFFSPASSSAAMLKSKLLNLHFTFRLSGIPRPIDHLFHVALLESPAGIVPAHLIFIGFSRHFAIVNTQYLMNDVERFLRLLAEK